MFEPRPSDSVWRVSVSVEDSAIVGRCTDHEAVSGTLDSGCVSEMNDSAAKGSIYPTEWREWWQQTSVRRSTNQVELNNVD